MNKQSEKYPEKIVFDINTFFTKAFALCEEIGNLHKNGMMYFQALPKTAVTDQVYMAPEQTGRLLLIPDYRTDMYLAGLVFYELLTGRHPFYKTDQAEMIHAHLARVPVSPETLDPSISGVISDITMRLLAKHPDERYQTVEGLKYDLDVANGYYNAIGNIPSFILATHDIADRKESKKTIYGRETEIEYFESLISELPVRRKALMLVEGEAGIGKSALIGEFARRLDARGLFIAQVKYSSDSMDTPYSAIIRAMNIMLNKMLSEKIDIFRRCQEFFSLYHPDLFSVFSEMLAPLKYFIVSRESAIPKEPTLLRDEFSHFIGSFIRFFCETYGGLSLIIEDFHWADAASHELTEKLLAGVNTGSFVLILSSRGKIPISEHPETYSHWAFRSILLGSLSKEDLITLISERYHFKGRSLQKVADIIGEKTANNPFFVSGLLDYFQARSIISFSVDNGWQFDEKAARQEPIADNIAELAVQRMKFLESDAADFLAKAALKGNRFSVKEISSIFEHSEETAFALLAQGVEKHCVIRITDDIYQFSHDMVLDAFTGHYEKAKKEEIHLIIARSLNGRIKEKAIDAAVFDIVRHYNSCLHLISDPLEKHDICIFNLSAARLSREAFAYNAALNFINIAESMCGDSTGEENRRSILSEKAECLFLTGSAAEAEKIFGELIRSCDNNYEKLEIHRQMMLLYFKRSAFDKAIDSAERALECLDVYLPKKLKPAAAAYEFMVSKIRFGGIGKLSGIPIITAQSDIAMVKLFSELNIIYVINGRIMDAIYIISRMVNIAFKKGITPDILIALQIYDTIIANIGLISTEQGYINGQIILGASEKICSDIQRVRTFHLFIDAIKPWKMAMSECLEDFITIYEKATANGDSMFATFAITKYLFGLWFWGKGTAKLYDEFPRAETITRVHNDPVFIVLVERFRRMIDQISGLQYTEDVFPRSIFNEGQPLAFDLLFSMEHAYIERRISDALGYAEKQKKHVRNLMGVVYYAESCFYNALILLAAYREGLLTNRRSVLRTVSSAQKKLKHWASSCPANFKHRYLLIVAELKGFRGDTDGAVQAYDNAINAAVENDSIKIAAIASECAARFHLRAGSIVTALHHASFAVKQYRISGIKARADNFEKEFPNIFSQAILSADKLFLPAADTQMLTKNALAITEEIDIDKLRVKILQTLLFLSGAQKACLLTLKNSELIVDAISPEGEISKNIPEFVRRTKQPVLLDNACDDAVYGSEYYIASNSVRSVLCFPLIRHDELRAVIYLENNLIPGAFSRHKETLLRYLSSQMAISLENASIYANLKDQIELNRRVDEERAQVQKQLYKSQKLEAVGTLANGISHDFNNILAIIIGYTELGKEDIEYAPRAFNEIMAAGKRGKALVEQLLAFSRQEKKKETDETADLIPVIAETVDLMSGRIENKITIRFINKNAGSCFVGMGETAIHQILMNMLVNAADAMEKTGGGITINIDRINAALIDQPGAAACDHYRITVSDTGEGIPEAVLPHIFEPFYTTKPKGKGTGLGLSTCYGLVKKHGGFINVQSSPGKGTVFEIFLPCRAQQIEGAAPVSNREEELKGKERLLVVDDERQIAYMLKARLEKKGYTVTEFSRSVEALKAFEGAPGNFDCVLTDLAMPEMDGKELILKIKRISPDIPVIVISGSVAEIDAEEWHKLGVKAVITKPVSFSELHEEIRGIFDQGGW